MCQGWTHRFQGVDLSNGDLGTYLVSTETAALTQGQACINHTHKVLMYEPNANILVYNENSLLQMIQNAHRNLMLTP